MGVIYDTIFQAWSWVPWVLGLGTIGWVILALLAPGLLNIISPILRGISEGLVEAWKWFYNGLTDILDDWRTIFTVCVLVWLAVNYVTWKNDSPKNARTPTVTTQPYGSKTQKVAPSNKQKEDKPAFSLQGWDWFHSK